MVVERFAEGQGTAVLCSAGLDSAVLLAEEARRAPVTPVYVSVGLAWEAAERQALRRLLEAPVYGGAGRCVELLQVEMRDVYPASHWAVTGQAPGYDTPDGDVYLPGRNLVLLIKAAVLCASRGLHRIALGPLSCNPFPDATPEFFDAMTRALVLGLDHRLEIATPFAHLRKAEVIRRGLELGVPLEVTLSCMAPLGNGGHCGVCSKCRERQDAFREAGIPDPTIYGAGAPSGAGSAACADGPGPHLAET
jgi:7-cyano-7-deazaguanine synthase